MPEIGTPLTANATRVMLLGAGELAKEIIIEFQRLGIEVIAVDNYKNAPGMQVAHKSHVINMLDSEQLRNIIVRESPDFIVPEIESIDTETLVDLETEGFKIVPSARATNLTMDREGIRKLVSEELGIATSEYRFASNFAEFQKAIQEISIPCVVKPVMSSSGKGQTLLEDKADIKYAWEHATSAARGNSEKVIVERFIDFDYEITLLTVQHKFGCSFCLPIGHRQEKGDYQESWQPHPMPSETLREAERIAEAVTLEIGGYGLFGVEFFIKDGQVYFSELSPRPHDTGMVTLISQDLSEFALHARAILGLPISNIRFRSPAASAVILVQGHSDNVSFELNESGLLQDDTQIRLFGKPSVKGERRMGVGLALGDTIEQARNKANNIANSVKYRL